MQAKEQETDHSIVISKADVEKLLEIPTDNRSNCFALYLFYRYTGAYQETDTIWCNDTFAAKGLCWDEDKTCRMKEVLIKMGLVKITKQFLSTKPAKEI